jgi:uroporphyrinogen decarboxylase
MGMREDQIRSLTFTHPEYIPVSIGVLPAAWIKYRGALDEIAVRHPLLFGEQVKRDYDAVSGRYVAGRQVDAWGCVWSNIKSGRDSIVTGHPVPTRAAVRQLKPPQTDDGFPHGFMWLRLADLRGFEEIMIDFAEEPPELQTLIDVVLAHNLRQGRIKLAELEAQGAPGSIVTFGDDLGMQTGLAIGPAKWRKHLKPCYEQIYRPFRNAGYYVYMHTDGHIFEIIPDLVDCGVQVVNPQIRANGLDNLARVCKGKVCVDLDLDRQLFPFCTPRDLEAVEKLGSPKGGLWLKAEIGDDVPLENIEAICAALEEYRTFY